jgi:hypothetical protein
MKRVGFGSVSWSDGSTPESQTVRLIAGFPAARSEEVVLGKEVSKKMQFGMETVVYKQLGNLAIHADVYFPLIPSSVKMPIGKPCFPTSLRLEKLTLQSSDDPRR